MGGGHGPKDEQREPRDVQGPVEGDVPPHRRRRGVAQGVQYLAHSRFLPEGEQAGPPGGHDRGDDPHPRERGGTEAHRPPAVSRRT